MLAEGKRAADHTGLMNVTFAHGDATALPYLDRSFTLVVTRFSLHQVADPEAVVKEMVRVSRPGAALIIADLVRRRTWRATSTASSGSATPPTG